LQSLVKDSWYQIAASITLMTFSLFLQAQNQPYETRLFNVIEAVAIVGIILTQLISMFYLRVDSFSASCLGADATFVIDAQGTTCADVAAAKASNDIVVTLAMAALNIMLVGGIVVILVRVVLAERKEAAAGGGKREIGGRKKEAKLLQAEPGPAFSQEVARRPSSLAALRSPLKGSGAASGSMLRSILPPLSPAASEAALISSASQRAAKDSNTSPSFSQINPLLRSRGGDAAVGRDEDSPSTQGDDAAGLRTIVSELTASQSAAERALQQEKARVAAASAESAAMRAELANVQSRSGRLVAKAEKSASESARRKVDAALAAVEAADARAAEAESARAEAEAAKAEALAVAAEARAEAAEAKRAAATLAASSHPASSSTLSLAISRREQIAPEHSDAKSAPAVVVERFERRFDDEDEWFVSLSDGRSEWSLPRGAVVVGEREWKTKAASSAAPATAALAAATLRAAEAIEAAEAARVEAIEAKRAAEAATAAIFGLRQQAALEPSGSSLPARSAAAVYGSGSPARDKAAFEPLPAAEASSPHAPFPLSASAAYLSTSRAPLANLHERHEAPAAAPAGDAPPAVAAGSSPAPPRSQAGAKEFFQSRLQREASAAQRPLPSPPLLVHLPGLHQGPEGFGRHPSQPAHRFRWDEDDTSTS
jgi:hypothetical protein